MDRQIVVMGTGGSDAISMLRNIRAAGVFGTMADVKKVELPEETKGVIVIGGENEATKAALRKVLEQRLPLLAFGAPAAVLCEVLGGTVRGHAFDEQLKDVRFANLGVCAGVDGGMRMLQGAEYLTLPQGCHALSVVEGAIMGFEDEAERVSGFQFLPETQDIETAAIVENFMLRVAGADNDYTCEDYAERMVEEIRKLVGEDGKAICLLSGGVDSTTAACLARKAVGDRLNGLVIDTGLGRPGEVDGILRELGEGMGFAITRIDASERMMERLRGCVTPQQKRHAVQVFLAACIAEEVEKLGGNAVVIQGTNYLDVLQVEYSPMVLPGNIKAVHPLEYLFKVEVRKLARQMGIPEAVVMRNHYPSAGMALRCMGAVDAEKLEALRAADAILRQVIEEAGQKRPNTQAFAVLSDVSEFFQTQGKRYVIILRAISGVDSGRASIQRLPQDVLEKAAERIMEEVDNVYRVVFDVTPTRVEWE